MRRLILAAMLPLSACASMMESSTPTKKVDYLAQGRQDVQLFYGKDKTLDDFYDQLSPTIQDKVTKDKIAEANQVQLSHIGGETDMVSDKVKVVRGVQIYVRTFHTVTAPGPFDFLVYLDDSGKIIDYRIKPHEEHPVELQTETPAADASAAPAPATAPAAQPAPAPTAAPAPDAAPAPKS